MNTIYFDLDGVLFDLDRRFIEITGQTINDFPSREEGWNALMHHKESLFLTLEPMHDAHILVEGVAKLAKKYKYNQGILTAIPQKNRIPFAQRQKIERTKQFFPKLLKNFNIGPYSYDKQYHCKLGDIIIDDSPMNIEQWDAKGGFGILHTSAEQSLYDLETYLRGY